VRACALSALFSHSNLFQVIQPKRGGGNLSAGVSAVLDVQWEAMRNGLLAQVEARKAELALAAAPVERADALQQAASECPDVAATNSEKSICIDFLCRVKIIGTEV
jgi:hypothetical protein